MKKRVVKGWVIVNKHGEPADTFRKFHDGWNPPELVVSPIYPAKAKALKDVDVDAGEKAVPFRLEIG